MQKSWLAGLTCTALCLASISPAAHGVQSEAARRAKAPVDAVLAVYVPQDVRGAHIYIPQLGAPFFPGRAVAAAGLDAGNFYFKSAVPFDPSSESEFTQVLVLHSNWDFQQRDSSLKIKYSLLDATGHTLIAGERGESIGTAKLFENNAFYSMALSVLRDILADDALLAKAAEATRSSVGSSAAHFDAAALVARDKPAKTGTGFFINEQGQVLTAAHVIHDCPVVAVKVDGVAVDGKVVAESSLLDLAVIDTGHAGAHIIPLRSGTSFELGEGVTNIGYPLDGLLASSPNVTKGNISSRAGLTGGLGQFQFSAPVQPGSSGGPVVSDRGELLGVTVGTLSVSGLVKAGILPQNVNFALDARYAASFLDRSKVAYVTVAMNRPADTRSAVETALPAVVQLACYE